MNVIKFLQRLYTAPLRLLSHGIGIYVRNRERLRIVLEKPKARLLVRGLVVATFSAWLLIWLLASQQQGDVLDRLIREKLPWLQGR